MTTMPHASAHLPYFPSPSAALPADGRRLFPAISLRVRASLTLRRLALGAAITAAPTGGNRRPSDDVRHAA